MCEAIVRDGGELVRAPRFHFPGDGLFTPLERPTGLPIGHLTSQHFANRFLSPVDHRAKDRLRVRAYLRYMDDLLLFDDDRARLQALGDELEAACHRQRLRLHPWQVKPTRAGVRWLGFRILPNEVRLLRSSARRAQRRLAERLALARADAAAWPGFVATLEATFAHWKHGTTWRLRGATLRELGLLHGETSPPCPLSMNGEGEKEPHFRKPTQPTSLQRTRSPTNLNPPLPPSPFMERGARGVAVVAARTRAPPVMILPHFR